MRTFQGPNPENRRVHTSKSWPSKKKPCKVPESVEVHIIDDDDDDSTKDYSVGDASKQLVLYNPEITHDKQCDIDHHTSLRQSSKKPRYGYGTVLPSIGAYTVQCANGGSFRQKKNMKSCARVFLRSFLYAQGLVSGTVNYHVMNQKIYHKMEVGCGRLISQTLPNPLLAGTGRSESEGLPLNLQMCMSHFPTFFNLSGSNTCGLSSSAS